MWEKMYPTVQIQMKSMKIPSKCRQDCNVPNGDCACKCRRMLHSQIRHGKAALRLRNAVQKSCSAVELKQRDAKVRSTALSTLTGRQNCCTGLTGQWISTVRSTHDPQGSGIADYIPQCDTKRIYQLPGQGSRNGRTIS